MKSFRDFIEAEVDEILRAVDADVRRDPERFRQEALIWIEKNAEIFRRHWEKKHAA